MAVADLTTAQINALIATRDPMTGLEYLASGTQPWHEWAMRTLNHLSVASAGALLVRADDASVTSIRVLPGRALLAGEVLVYAGGAIDLAAFNNDTAYIWIYNSTPGTPGSPTPAIGTASGGGGGAGWPNTPHIKLAEVTLATGVITVNLDRRFESVLMGGFADRYDVAVTTAGDTGTPSVITITTADLAGVAQAKQGILRVRVCDSGGAGYANASNATIAAGANTTVVETITATKDLVVQGHTDGTFTIDLTDATAETVLLRIGPPPLSGDRADYSPTLNVTHATP